MSNRVIASGHGRYARQRVFAALLMAGVCTASCTMTHAEEISTFGFSGIEGNVSVRYLDDSTSTQNGGGAAAGSQATREAQKGLRSELFVMTHSYIYHPNFITLDIGGGPILDNEQFDNASSQTSAREQLYNLTGRMTILRDKPYHGSLFFEHLNPTVSLAPGQVVTQENLRYGADFALLAPASPIPLHLDVVHFESKIRAQDRQVDDRSNQLNLSASVPLQTLGTTQISYQASRQTSLSGSPQLPIQASSSDSQNIALDTRLQFGADRQYDVTHLISMNTQNYVIGASRFPALNDLRLVLDMRARHADNWYSYGNYNYGHSTQGDIDTTLQGISAGMNYRLSPAAETDFGLRSDSTETGQLSMRSLGLNGAIRYEQELPVGVAQLSYGARLNRYDQQASGTDATILGERLELTGTAYATLARPRVIDGSLTLSNATRSQVFVAGRDYLLTVIGQETRIQRLISGAILDGETVLADYHYDVGGTYAYRQADQNVHLGWNISRHINVYFRQTLSSPQLLSGAPTFPLNEVNVRTYGARADIPFHPGIAMTAGAGYEFEDRQETIAPYRRQTDDLFLQTDEPLFGLGYFRATRRHARINYANALLDSDLVAYDFRYWLPEWFGLDINAAWTTQQDRGSLQDHQRSDQSITAQWRERKLTVNASFIHTSEKQGEVSRTRTAFQLTMKRDF